MSQYFTLGGQSIGVSASVSVLPVNIQDWFPLGWTGWISLQFKSISSLVLSFLYSPTLTSTHDYWKNHSFDEMDPCCQSNVSGIFNTLSRFVITFLPRSKCLLISWLQSPSAVILEPPKINCVTVSIVSPSVCYEVMGPDAMTLVFRMLSFKPTFLLSSSIFIKKPFSSLLSAIMVMSSAYLRLLIFLPAILIPACASSSPAFIVMYSTYKLNKQGDNIQPWFTPFPI